MLLRRGGFAGGIAESGSDPEEYDLLLLARGGGGGDLEGLESLEGLEHLERLKGIEISKPMSLVRW